MGLVNPSQSSPGDTIDAADINDPVNQLAAVINGNIDTNNIAANGVGTTQLADASVTEAKMTSRPSEFLADFIYSGGVVAQSAGLTGTFSNIVYYIGGIRYTATSVSNKTYTASKDTYVDIGTDGTVDYNEVANGAASPSLSASHIRVAKVVTSGAAITSVSQVGSDSLGNPIYNNDANKQNAWRAWTPTWTNLTVGSGTVTAWYTQIGKTVNCEIGFVVGAGSAIGTTPTFTLPVIADSRYSAATTYPHVGGLYIEDAGSTGYLGKISIVSTTTAGISTYNSAGTFLTATAVTGAVPFTWGSGDFFIGSFTYEAA